MAFDTTETKNYERWFLTPAGMYVDDKEKELLINTMRFKRGEKVLEIGAGTGRYMEYLEGLGLDVTGIEPMQEYAKMAVAKSTINPSKMIVGNFEGLS